MSKSLNKIKEMLCDALDDYAKKGELSAGSLSAIDTLTHSLKSVVTIMAMEDEYDNGASYDGGNMGGGVSGARGRSRTTGRYVSRDGYSGRRDWRDERGMSYDGARTELIEHVDELMGMAQDEPTRAMIRRFKSQLETA